MTTTPAPLDLDLDAIEAYLCRPSHSVDRLHGHATQLLDALATERRQSAAMASITGEAIRQLGEERDAAREELAKTRAELANATILLIEAVQHSGLSTVLRQRINGLLAEASPATTAEPATPHCGLCGSETCPGKPGEGCMPGPFETYEPAAREVTLAEAAQQARLNLIEAEQRRVATAEPADEPKATCDLADPNACRHCGINDQDHANRWTETVGWHTWVDPGNEVRKTRMLLRRQNRKPAAS